MKNKTSLLTTIFFGLAMLVGAQSFERQWDQSKATDNAPSFLDGNTTCGIAATPQYLFIASRSEELNPDKKTILYLNPKTGERIGTLDVGIITPSAFSLNDVEVSDDGQILTSNIAFYHEKWTADGTWQFKVYKWIDVNAAPTLFIDYANPHHLRLGDVISVKGDITQNAVFYSSVHQSPKVVRWEVVNGVLNPTPEIIHLVGIEEPNNQLGFPKITPIGVTKNDPFYFNATAIKLKKFSADGTTILDEVIPAHFTDSQGFLGRDNGVTEFTVGDKTYVAALGIQGTGAASPPQIKAIDVTDGLSTAREPFHSKPLNKVIPSYGITDIADLVLIYQGGVHRSFQWTKEQFLPYVIHEDRQGNKNWLFDGFLFLEFKDGKGYTYAPGYDNMNARRVEWEWLLDRRFAANKAFSGLDQCVEEQKVIMGDPNFKHKVISGMPSPILNQKDWGKINGKALDFSKVDDRLAAAKWYIDQFLNRFYSENYQHLDFSGFYWVDEDVTGASDILKPLGDYVRSKGLRFYWIPYWNAAGSRQWKNYKFDFAWMQPNYFFQDVNDSRLDAACDLAFEQNMGLEMEFDYRALYGRSDNRRDRLISYIDAFERNQVFNKSSIAYYQGGNCIYDFYISTHPKDKEVMDRLANFIIKRKSWWYSTQ